MADDKTYRLYHPGQTPVYAKHSGYFPNGKPSVKWVDNPSEASEFSKKEARQIAGRSEGIKPIVDRHPNSYPAPARATAPIAPAAAGVPAKTKTVAAPLKAKAGPKPLSNDAATFLDDTLKAHGYKPGTPLKDVHGSDLAHLRSAMRGVQNDIIDSGALKNARGKVLERGKADPGLTQAMRAIDSEIAREKAFIKKQGDLFNPERAPNAPKPGVVKVPKGAARVTAAVSRTMLNASPVPKPQAARATTEFVTIKPTALANDYARTRERQGLVTHDIDYRRVLDNARAESSAVHKLVTTPDGKSHIQSATGWRFDNPAPGTYRKLDVPRPQASQSSTPTKAPGKTLAGVALSAAMAALSGMTAKPAEASGADRTKPYTYVRDGRTVEVVNGRLITRK